MLPFCANEGRNASVSQADEALRTTHSLELLALYVGEVVVGGADLDADVGVGLPAEADLSAEQVLVVARELVVLVGREVEVGVEDRERTGHQEGHELGAELVFALDHRAVEAEVRIPDEIGGVEEGIVEASGADRHLLDRLILDEGAIQPDRVLAEVAARGAERLVRRDR